MSTSSSTASVDSDNEMSSFLENLRQRCVQRGFDVCDPIHTAWYNNLIEEEGHLQKGTLKKLPEPRSIHIANQRASAEDVSSSSLSYNAVLIGNSKSIWPEFIQWIHTQYKLKVENCTNDHDERRKGLDLILQSNPFDTFVMDRLLEVFKTCCNGNGNGREAESEAIPSKIASYEFFWSSGNRTKVNVINAKTILDQDGDASASTTRKTDQYHCFASKDDSFLVSMQRVAKVTGKYWHDEEGTKLCVHPKFGTWKAFRAVVVFTTRPEYNIENNRMQNDEVIPAQPPYCPCPVIAEEITAAKDTMEYAIKVSSGESNIDYGVMSSTTDGDGDSSNDQDRLCTYLHNTVTPGSNWTKVPLSMRPWIQLRDCITIGRDEHKYSDPQLLYHYTKDPDILINELRKRSDLLRININNIV